MHELEKGTQAEATLGRAAPDKIGPKSTTPRGALWRVVVAIGSVHTELAAAETPEAASVARPAAPVLQQK